MIDTAVIVAAGLPFFSGRKQSTLIPSVRFAGLPLIVRTLFSAQKAEVRRAIIIFDDRHEALRRLVARQHRLKLQVEWLPVSQVGRLPNMLSDPFFILPCDRVFDYKMLKPLREDAIRSGEDVVSAISTFSNREPMGVFAARPSFFTGASTDMILPLLHDPVRGRQASSFDAGRAYCQRVWNTDEVRAANQKLDASVYKDTDNILARLNRKVSIPISRLLLPAPVTPNQVTLFTLLVSLAAGVLFSFGGYWFTVSGAMVSLFACILDGVDGEVARFKFQDSAFGCWLEAVCDNLYYVFVYTGMVAGLYRESGNMVYPAVGIVLMAGGILSMIVFAIHRRKMAGRNPERYALYFVRERAKREESSPVFKFIQRFHHLILRSTLPYAILANSLIDFNDFTLFMSAFGANVAWIFTLYSMRVFERSAAAAPLPSLDLRISPSVRERASAVPARSAETLPLHSERL